MQSHTVTRIHKQTHTVTYSPTQNIHHKEKHRVLYLLLLRNGWSKTLEGEGLLEGSLLRSIEIKLRAYLLATL